MFGKIFGIIIIVIIVIAVISHFYGKYQDKKNREETRKLIINHANNKDYLWLIENCESSSSINNVRFQYDYSYELSNIIKLEDAFSKVNIDYKKRITLAYKHNFIHATRVSTGQYTVWGDFNKDTVFNAKTSNNEDLVLKYLVYYLSDKDRAPYKM